MYSDTRKLNTANSSIDTVGIFGLACMSNISHSSNFISGSLIINTGLHNRTQNIAKAPTFHAPPFNTRWYSASYSYRHNSVHFVVCPTALQTLLTFTACSPQDTSISTSLTSDSRCRRDSCLPPSRSRTKASGPSDVRKHSLVPEFHGIKTRMEVDAKVHISRPLSCMESSTFPGTQTYRIMRMERNVTHATNINSVTFRNMWQITTRLMSSKVCSLH
jgi:hypothetical protein